MDANRLLNLLFLLENFDKEDETPRLLSELSSLLTQVQSNSGVAPQITEKHDEIKAIIKASPSSQLAPSYLRILDNLGGAEYIGHELLDKIDEIFAEHQYNTAALAASFTGFMQERAKFLQTVSSISTGLDNLGMEAHYLEDDYEIGIKIPEKDDMTTIPKIEKQLHNWNILIKQLNELTGHDSTDVKITRTSNGSIEIYLQQAYEVADCIATLMAKIAGVYITVRAIRKHRAELKKLKAPAGEMKAIEAHEKKVIDDEIKETSEGLVKQYGGKVEAKRKNELKTAVQKGMRFIARSVEDGIEIEVIPPEIETPSEPGEEETPEQKKKRLAATKKLERANLIKKSAEAFKSIGSIGDDAMKMLDGGEDLDD